MPLREYIREVRDDMATIRRETPTFTPQYDPSEISHLAAEYMETDGKKDEKAEEAGKRIRVDGDFSRENLEVIYRWKSPRAIRRFRDNTDGEIRQALKKALGASDVEKATCALTSLKGVGVKMASAILTAIDPERYTVLDFRALEALGVKNSENLNLYIQYVKACRSLAEKYGVTLRNFDRANWQWSKNQSRNRAAAKRRGASA
jgi:hypothetical protein